MERMTQDGVDVCRDLCMDYDECTSTKLNPPIICLKAATYNKLREYEKTGLVPEEINVPFILPEQRPVIRCEYCGNAFRDELGNIVHVERNGKNGYIWCGLEGRCREMDFYCRNFYPNYDAAPKKDSVI